MMITDINNLVYPKDLLDLIKDSVKIVSKMKPYAIVLIGSTSRGEFTYVTKDNDISLYSDLEFYVFTRGKTKEDIMMDIRNSLDEYSEKISKNNPLFNIDVGFVLIDNIHRLPRDLRIFEMTTNGLVVYGNKDILNKIPRVNLQNIDMGHINSLIYLRLWDVIKRFPLTLKTEEQSTISNYIISRNIIELPSIILPHEGHMISTYKNRIKKMSDVDNSADFQRFFGKDFSQDMQKYYVLKMNPGLKRYRPEIFQDFLKSYQKTIDYLNQIYDNEIIYYNDKKITRFAHESSQALKNIIIYRPSEFCLLCNRRTILINSLMHFCHSIYHYQIDDLVKANSHIKQSKELLEKILCKNISFKKSYKSNYDILRKETEMFFEQFLNKSKRKKISMDEKDEETYCIY